MLRSGRPRTAAVPWTAGDVAGQLEVVVRADLALAQEMDRIGACRAPVCTETVTRLEALLVGLRDAARVRTDLALLDPELLRAGAALWVEGFR